MYTKHCFAFASTMHASIALCTHRCYDSSSLQPGAYLTTQLRQSQPSLARGARWQIALMTDSLGAANRGNCGTSRLVLLATLQIIISIQHSSAAWHRRPEAHRSIVFRLVKLANISLIGFKSVSVFTPLSSAGSLGGDYVDCYTTCFKYHYKIKKCLYLACLIAHVYV